eukprot:m.151702 g.151702  ORF g.151702 m.151702 type:complete len:189 (-) comp17871_c0_seq10:59-625(-)
MKHDIPDSQTKGGRIYVPIADGESIRALEDGIFGQRRKKIIKLLQKEGNPCRSFTPPASPDQIIDIDRESVVRSSEHLPEIKHLLADLVSLPDMPINLSGLLAGDDGICGQRSEKMPELLHMDGTPCPAFTPPTSPEQCRNIDLESLAPNTADVLVDPAWLFDGLTPSIDFDASTSDDCFDHILCMFD